MHAHIMFATFQCLIRKSSWLKEFPPVTINSGGIGTILYMARLTLVLYDEFIFPKQNS